MHNYEIRILRGDGSSAIITAEIHFCDEAAIHAGERNCQGNEFEVWRGIDCVFSSRHTGAVAPLNGVLLSRLVKPQPH